MRIALVKSLRMPLPQIRPWAMSGTVQRMFIVSVLAMPELPRKTLKRCLDLARTLEKWRSPLVDYDVVIRSLSNRANHEVSSKLSALIREYCTYHPRPVVVSIRTCRREQSVIMPVTERGRISRS